MPYLERDQSYMLNTYSESNPSSSGYNKETDRKVGRVTIFFLSLVALPTSAQPDNMKSALNSRECAAERNPPAHSTLTVS